MSDEEIQDDVAQEVPTDSTESAAGEATTEEQNFGTDEDVDPSADTTSDATAETESMETSESTDDTPGDSEAGFDAASLPEIEAEYRDENIRDVVVRCLTPVSDDAPCGQGEEAASSVISQIETTIDAIHESLRSGFGDAVRDENTAGFDIASTGREASELVEQIATCMESECKSTILASYLPQLMLIEYGLEGFAAGLDIFRGLLERFEAYVFPRDREKLMSFLRRGVFVGNDDKVTDNFKLFLYQPVTEGKRLPYALLRNSRIRGANTDVESKYAHDASASSVDFYVHTIGDMETLIASAKSANKKVGELLEDPMFEIVSYSFVDSLERMLNIVNGLATDNCSGYPPVETEEEDETGEAGTETVAKAAAAVTGEITTREQAIDLLGRIADFFHRTERHSPVSYRIRETIRWCKMDLPELLQELLHDDQGPLDELGKRVGFRAMESDGDDYDG